MASFRRCRARFKWSYIDNYSPASGKGLSRGSIGHKALAQWYTQGCTEQADIEAMKLVSSEFGALEASTGESVDEEFDLMAIIMPRYFDWARANDNFTEIIEVEKKFDLLLDGHKFTGYIDGIVKIKNSIWLLEHKFNKQVSTNHIDLDPQMSLYMLAAYKMGIEAKGVLFNVIRVAKGGIAEREPVARRQVFRNTEGLAVIEREAIIQMEEMDEFLDGSNRRVYRNPTGNCPWDCGFFNTCLSINDDGDAASALARIPIVPHVSAAEEDKQEE